MNENLDLTKILEGCPKGTEFYSNVWGKLFLVEINPGPSAEYPMLFKSNDDFSVFITKNGRLYNTYEDSECIVFPSKDQRDWAKFERFWDKSKEEKFDPKTLQPFDKVLVRDCSDELWSIELFSHKTSKILRGLFSNWCCAIPYNEETKHIVGTREDCPEHYKWWEE